MVNPGGALPHITFVIHDMEGGVASMNHQIIENADFGRHFRGARYLVEIFGTGSQAFPGAI